MQKSSNPLGSFRKPQFFKSRSKENWGHPSMFPSFLRLLLWITQTKEHKASFSLLMNRIAVLYKTNGATFAFQYLKEATRLTLLFLAGTPSNEYKSIRVKRDRDFIPTIIPLNIRLLLKKGDITSSYLSIKALLTILTIYRCFKFKVDPDISSIIQPFSGEVQTLNLDRLKRCIQLLSIRPIKITGIKSILSNNSGPNAKIATLGCVIDAFALLFNPKILISLIKLYWLHRSVSFIIYILFFLIYLTPFFLIYMTFRAINTFFYVVIENVSVFEYIRLRSRVIYLTVTQVYKPRLGKLSVVRDQAGKARIVAITNWWIQIALKPLHDSLFLILKNIEMDGTYDQTKPLKALLNRLPLNQTLYSFDLSAATDRLPIALQEQVLGIIYPGSRFWRAALDFAWVSKYSETPVKYAVGQPMGAYSSWGMLALTHHVLVQYAAILAGYSRLFKDYCVLGDDVVIANDAVAREYQKLMSILGMEINLSKSLVSKRLCEFAKTWMYNPDGSSDFIELTPLGSKNMIGAIKSPVFIPGLLVEALRKGFFEYTGHIVIMIDDLSFLKMKVSPFVIAWTMFWVDSDLVSGKLSETLRLLSLREVYTNQLAASLRVYEVVSNSRYSEMTEALRTNLKSMDNFWLSLYIESLRLDPALRLLTIIGIFFLDVTDKIEEMIHKEIKEHFQELREIPETAKALSSAFKINPNITPDEVIELAKQQNKDITSIDLIGCTKEVAKEYNKRIYRKAQLFLGKPVTKEFLDKNYVNILLGREKEGKLFCDKPEFNAQIYMNNG